jgi:hypothetical protein
MNRAAQIGEAPFRISDLEVPLYVLARVLCEDFLTVYWLLLSDENADEYCKIAESEQAKWLHRNFAHKHARVVDSSGNDVTAQDLPIIESRLEVADIDFARNIIHVRRSGWEGQKQSTKSRNANRAIDVQPSLITMLRESISTDAKKVWCSRQRTESRCATTTCFAGSAPNLAGTVHP